MTWELSDDDYAELQARFATVKSRGASILTQASLISDVLARAQQIQQGRFVGDPGKGNLLFGLKTDDTGPAGPNDLTIFEQTHDLTQPVALHRSYFQPTDQAALVARVTDDLGKHRVPWVSTKLPAPWGQVANGAQDAWLAPLLADVEQAADGHLVLLTLHHEPEDDQASMGTAADYCAMYDHAIGLLSPDHTLQVLPCLIGYGHWTWTGAKYGTPQSWVSDACTHAGSDAYNPWYPGQPAGTWHSAADCLDNVDQLTAARPDLIQWIGEWATKDDTATPGKAAGWMGDFYDGAIERGVAGISFYSSALNAPNGPWTLDGERLAKWLELNTLATSVHTA